MIYGFQLLAIEGKKHGTTRCDENDMLKCIIVNVLSCCGYN